jgi:hypothetical protein
MKNVWKSVVCIAVVLVSFAMTTTAARNTPKPLGSTQTYFAYVGWNYVSIPIDVTPPTSPVSIRDTFCNSSLISPPDNANCTKKKGFEALGYSYTNRQLLVEDLKNQAINNWKLAVHKPEVKIINGIEQIIDKYTIETAIVGPNGKEGLVKTVWELKNDNLRIVTAIPKPYA